MAKIEQNFCMTFICNSHIHFMQSLYGMQLDVSWEIAETVCWAPRRLLHCRQNIKLPLSIKISWFFTSIGLCEKLSSAENGLLKVLARSKSLLVS